MFTFTEDCLLGVDFIDEEHKYLFELLNKIIDICHNEFLTDRYDEISMAIQELEDYADRHFKEEEEYMLKIRDPELIRQRMQHDYFRLKIDEMAVTGISENEEQQKVLEDMTCFLAKWLYGHIIGSDIMIGKLPPLEEWMLRENPCEFTDDFLVGNDLIDGEHKQLFKIIEQAYQLVKENVTIENLPEIEIIIKQLQNYCIEHFQDEEEYMESIQYKGIEAQKRAHNAFIDRIDEIDLQNMKEDLQRNLEELVEYLLGWLVNHIMNMDKKIPTF